MSIRVVVADDQALVRAGFRLLVNSAPDLEVVGEAVDGAQAVELARHQRPNVVLMDIRMPQMDGLEATRHITADALLAGVRVLMLTTFDLDEYVYQALRAGASGFLLKDTPPADLLAAIRVVAAGDALLAPGITRRLIAEFARRPDPGRSGLVGRPDRPRAGGVGLGRARAVEQRAGRAAGGELGDVQDLCEPAVGQAGGSRPGPAGGDRLRERPGRARRPLSGPVRPGRLAVVIVAEAGRLELGGVCDCRGLATHGGLRLAGS
jgi:DNA-binding NarL/FixJ family response regulator